MVSAALDAMSCQDLIAVELPFFVRIPKSYLLAFTLYSDRICSTQDTMSTVYVLLPCNYFTPTNSRVQVQSNFQSQRQ